MDPSSETTVIACWRQCLLAIVLRVVLVAWATGRGPAPQVFFEPDTESYLATAESLWHHHRFAIGETMELERTPGYPLLLAVGVALGRPAVWTLVIQVCLSALMVWLASRLAYYLHAGRRGQAAAAWLAACEPLGVVFTARLTTETVFAVLVLAAVVWLARGAALKSSYSFVIAALVAAVAAYVRPIGFGLPAVLGGVAALRAAGVSRAERRTAWITWAGMLVLAYSLLGLWQLRNATRASYPKFSAIADVNLYFYHAAAVEAVRDGRPFLEVQAQRGYHDPQQYFAEQPLQREWSPAARYLWQGHTAREQLAAERWLALRVYLGGVLRGLLDPGAVDFARLLRYYPQQGGLLGRAVDGGLWAVVRTLAQERPWLLAWHVLLELVWMGYALLALRGGWRLRGQLGAVAAVLVIAYLLLAAGGPQTLARFRQPVMPLVAVLAGIGWERVSSRRGNEPESTGAPAHPS